MARLLWGILLGVLVGGAFAAVAIKVFALAVLGSLLAYAMAAGVGLLMGLVAGKPIWRKGAAIEAGLKALFGMAASVGLMFAMRRWLHLELDLTSFGLGQGAVSELAVTSFPAIGVVLGLLFEADNLVGKDDDSGPKKRIASDEPNKRLASDSVEQHDEQTSEGSKRRRA